MVLCCVTGKYTRSENCQREVTLSDALRKPIIPLLFEKIEWPPAGPMSMPFCKLLYIKMINPEEPIPKDKFQELVKEVKERM